MGPPNPRVSIRDCGHRSPGRRHISCVRRACWARQNHRHRFKPLRDRAHRLFSLRVLVISLLLMVPIGFGMMVQMTSSNTILQTIVEEDKRGRVMSFYAMAFMGMVPFGSLLAGVWQTGLELLTQL